MKVEELRKIVAAATPGPWKWNTHPHDRYLLSKAPGISEDDDLILGGAFDALGIKKPNARFIATFSPSLVARLLDVVEAATRLRQDLWLINFSPEQVKLVSKLIAPFNDTLRALEGSDDE